MLHAFDAASGAERFAYVPNAVIENFRLTKIDSVRSGFHARVDDKPMVTDAFINGGWQTVLLGSLRLGGRGVYLWISPMRALRASTETAGEFECHSGNLPTLRRKACDTSSDCAPGGRHLLVAGLHLRVGQRGSHQLPEQVGGAGVERLFPPRTRDPARPRPAANQTSLLVIDLANGHLDRRCRTSTAPQIAGPESLACRSRS